MDFYQYSADWNESRITWNNQPASTDTKLFSITFTPNSSLIKIDIQDYILNYVSSMSGLQDIYWSVELRSSIPLNVFSKESTKAPRFRVVHYDPNWSGFVGINDIGGTAVIRQYSNVDLDSTVELYDIEDLGSTAFIDFALSKLPSEIEIYRDPANLNSKVILDYRNHDLISTANLTPKNDLEGVVSFRYNNDLSAEVLIPEAGSNEFNGVVTILNLSLISTATLYSSENILSEVLIVYAETENLDSIVEFTHATENLDSIVELLFGEGTALESIVDITSANFPSTVQIYLESSLESTATIYGVEIEGILSTVSISRADLEGNLSIPLNQDLDGTVSITGVRQQDLPSTSVIIGSNFEGQFKIPEYTEFEGIISIDTSILFPSTVRIVDQESSENIISTVYICSPQLDGKVDIFLKSDLDGTAYITGSYLDSVINITGKSIDSTTVIKRNGNIDLISDVVILNARLAGSVYITNAFLPSITEVYTTSNINSTVNLYRYKDLDGTVLILKGGLIDLESTAVIMQEDLNFIKSEVSICIISDLDGEAIIKVNADYPFSGIVDLRPLKHEPIDSQATVYRKGIFDLTLDTTPPLDFNASLDTASLTETNPYVYIDLFTSDADVSKLEVFFQGINFEVVGETLLSSGWYRYTSRFKLKITGAFFFIDIRCRDDVWNESHNIPHFELLYPSGTIKPTLDLTLDTTAPDVTVVFNDGSPEIYSNRIKFEFITSDLDILEFKMWGDFYPTENRFKSSESTSSWIPFKKIINSYCTLGLGMKHFYIKFRDDVWNESQIYTVEIEFTEFKMNLADDTSLYEEAGLVLTSHISEEPITSVIIGTVGREMHKPNEIFNIFIN